MTTYVGHSVLKTLIRCHFSPPSSTGQQYLYSGSENGKIHIWNIDGTVARVIDVGQALTNQDENGWSFYGMTFGGMKSRRGVTAVVRDVSWHPYEAVLVSGFMAMAYFQVSSSWTSIRGESGAVTVHAWDHER